MSGTSIVKRAGLFFVVGPLRTGSSLMARCIDDHPAAICLCESEINRALFNDYFLELHCERMMGHGLALSEVIRYLDRKKQDDIASWLDWYSDISPRLAALYGKHYVPIFGEKSPNLFEAPRLVAHVAENYPLIYTVRDPRAILRSILVQDDTLLEDKADRWYALIQNYVAWKPYLDEVNLLVVRYEDLITAPTKTMESVYSHLNLPMSLRFLDQFPRLFPQRFLWETSVAAESGIRKDFDPSRINSWRRALTDEQLGLVYSNATLVEFMARFGYEK
jgi:hypothetical protein